VFTLEDYPEREARDAAMADWLEARGVELVVCAGYMHLLSPPFLARFPQRVVNVHPSLLPAFPGTRAVEDALGAGADVTGVTIHLVDEGIDTGPILAQEPLEIAPVETLVERIHAVEHRLLPKVVSELCAP
jgi:phosphoribosylglycinamide formyltransferase-1